MALIQDKHPLIVACKAGDAARIEALVRENTSKSDVAARLAYVNAHDRNGSTGIVHCVWDGHVKAAEKLLELGADPNAANVRQNTALHLACQQGHLDVVRCLMRHGANMRARNWQELAAHEMCAGDEAAAEMKALLEAEAAAYERDQVAKYETVMTPEERAYYRAVFATVDTDGSGDLSYGELRSLLVTMLDGSGGGEPDEADVREFFDFFDADHSESISLSEFLRGCSRYVGDRSKAAKASGTARGRVHRRQRKVSREARERAAAKPAVRVRS